jgi:phosphohistidine swiveling domain-containing protein
MERRARFMGMGTNIVMESNKDVLACRDSAYVRAHKGEFGGKTVALAMLDGVGYPVPPFVAVTGEAVFFVDSLATRDISLGVLANLAHGLLQSHSYAVRSSAFVEDGANASHAGEFLTETNCSPEELPHAMSRIILDAREKGHVTKDRPFSLIIQEYIHADCAGVIFTRNPLGGRESVIEWRRGVGSAVVGGKKVARVSMNQDAHVHREYFPGMNELFALARAIERVCGFPQDIEWAIKGGKISILQSRPITTLSRDDFMQYRAIDELFLHEDIYYFSRSGIGESFASCTPLALSVLQLLYAHEGPIPRAYQSLGIDVAVRDNFRLIHGSLYVDNVGELAQFFPAYTYGVSERGMIPRVAGWSGLIRTLQNARRLKRIFPPHPHLVSENLARHARVVEEMLHVGSVSTAKILELLMSIYQDIFLTNLYAEHVFRETEKSLQSLPFPLASLLSIPMANEKARTTLFRPEIMEHMKGNSLNIGDQSLFVVHTVQREPQIELATWWGNLNGKERGHIEKQIRRAKEYQQSREEGRHITVLLVCLLRESLQDALGITDKRIYFATLDEHLSKSVTQEELHARMEAWEKDTLPNMPSVIATVPPHPSQGALGVSAGLASGVVTISVDATSVGTILLVERLTPNLAPCLSRVAGIIATEGGMLSHVAILAREAGVPVVIDASAKEKIKSGMQVSIDGGLGTVVIHHKE